MARRNGMSIRELARELGLSVSTVSRAMNARSDVSAATVERVREAAARLGYIPNQTGRALRGGATNAVALVMPTAAVSAAVGETFFLTMASGLQETLSAAGRDLIILPYGASVDTDSYLANAADRGLADAYIVAGTRQVDPRIEYLSVRGIPFVALGRTARGNHPWLDLDYEGVAARSVARLAGFGHRRIALGIPAGGVNNATLFAASYRQALAENGLAFDPALLVAVPQTRDGGYELGVRLDALARPPTAVILLMETMAIGLYRYLRDKGRHPGRDLSIIGFRKNPVLDLLAPALTCFRVSLEDYGRCLGELILRQMRVPTPSAGLALDPGGNGNPQMVWQLSLVPGQSDGPPP